MPRWVLVLALLVVGGAAQQYQITLEWSNTVCSGTPYSAYSVLIGSSGVCGAAPCTNANGRSAQTFCSSNPYGAVEAGQYATRSYYASTDPTCSNTVQSAYYYLAEECLCYDDCQAGDVEYTCNEDGTASRVLYHDESGGVCSGEVGTVMNSTCVLDSEGQYNLWKCVQGSPNGPSPGTIAGAVIGSILGAALVAGAVLLYVYRDHVRALYPGLKLGGRGGAAEMGVVKN